MALPSLTYQRADGQTGAGRSSNTGIFAVIAASASGTAAKPAQITNKQQALTLFGHGELAEFCAYLLDVAKKPVIACKVAASTTGSYGALTTTGAPGASPSAITAGASKPVDRFDVVVEFTKGGTIGSSGIKYRYRLNGGAWAAEKALGTATTLSIPDTGIGLAFAAGDIADGEQVTFSTEGPQAILSDLTACFAALKATSLDYEAVLVGSVEADATMVAGLETLVSGFEPSGLFKRVVTNVRSFDQSSESAEDYRDDLAIISSAGRTGIRVDVGADGGFVPSSIRGIKMWRPTSLGFVGRVAQISLGTDAAYVADGPVSGFSVVDADGSPLCWDEQSTPGLDDLGYITLRTFARRSGCFIGNPRVFSPVGSDYVFDQQSRCMNAALERSYDFLTEELSNKKRKDPKLGPDGEVYLLEADVLDMETKGTLFLKGELSGEVDGVRLTLSRVDDVGANSGAVLTASVEISSLIYIKGFAVTARFVRSFTV